MSAAILREIKALETRVQAIEDKIKETGNTNNRIRDRLKVLGDKITAIEAELN